MAVAKKSFDLKTMFSFSSDSKKTAEVIKTFNHVSGKGRYVFSIPGIDPKNLKVINKNRVISIINFDKVICNVTTYDQIDVGELKIEYKFGQLVIIIEPNPDKYKEYEVKVQF